MNFLMNNSLAGKSIIKKLNEKNISTQKKFKEIEKNLRDEENTIASQKNILSKDEYVKKVKKFTEKIEKYKLSRNNTINDISKLKSKAHSYLSSSTNLVINLLTSFHVN